MEYISRVSDDLASDSEGDKKLKAAETHGLRKQKIKVTNNYVSSFRQINKRDEISHNPQSFRPKIFCPIKFDNLTNTQHQFSNYQGHIQQKHQKAAARALFRMWKTG